MNFAEGYRDYASDVELVHSIEELIFTLKKRDANEFGLTKEEWEWVGKLEECKDSIHDYLEANYD